MLVHGRRGQREARNERTRGQRSQEVEALVVLRRRLRDGLAERVVGQREGGPLDDGHGFSDKPQEDRREARS